ncbi:MAG: methyltransferase domain-containing protein [Alphaproteobacteria bacterium]
MPSSRNAKLKNFYNTELGRYLHKSLIEEIYRYWPDIEGKNLLELGHKNIYSDKINVKNKLYISPTDFIKNKIPKENSFDKILVVHCLEYLNDIQSMLQTLWNILTPEGKLLIIVPNRYSVLPVANINIFKKAKLFTLYEIINLLNDNHFLTIKSSSRVFLTLNFYKNFPTISNFFDHVGSKWFIPFGTFLIIEAKKTTYAPILKVSPFVKPMSYSARVSNFKQI